ncbi:dTDP-4-amino-4,6-dideoxygalactose transaminase [Thermosyntropha lipolytica DSM 11003]|uniref:dTDP-4-amino-4,6-dideoxygalactose transaminase n=1 Tax=Thermosyntropha lipolytica DSM 11003 TaxID=1123382 RepID=A0A1M5LKD6_9FIRM|nr:dTDP-4-amino-4,6-dideoxygalactose transaminase [Thermosyntropha lipolytica]SHG65582.1 dTDP-4-amino-4,6-dideoxygalactose transaminase [Thermosyntropha lipolytica DSM 11003]
MYIPFNRLYFSGRELACIKDCLKRNSIAGNGYYTGKVQDFMASRFKAEKVFLTTSATSALEMASLLLSLKPGDEVIMPSFTFVSTANAVMLRGAKPVFAEIDPRTLNIDPEDVKEKISPHTRAIIPVHYAGVACDMDSLLAISREYGLFIIEDAAQGVNALYKGRYLGTIGHIGCYSFHGTKNYSCGEGGALLLNGLGKDMLKKAEYIWEKGTNRSSFLRGEIDRYTWMEIGSSYTPSDILAAYLYAQLQDMDMITEKREKIYYNYLNSLREYEKKGLLKLPYLPDYAVSNYHIFYIIFAHKNTRDYVQEKLKQRGIESASHYVPLHLSPMGKRLGYRPGELPLTEKLADGLLRLPLYPDMTAGEQEYVIENLRKVLHELE